MLRWELCFHAILKGLVPLGGFLIGLIAYREIHVRIGHVLIVRLVLMEARGKGTTCYQ